MRPPPLLRCFTSIYQTITTTMKADTKAAGQADGSDNASRSSPSGKENSDAKTSSISSQNHGRSPPTSEPRGRGAIFLSKSPPPPSRRSQDPSYGRLNAKSTNNPKAPRSGRRRDSDYESYDDAVHNASAEAFQRAWSAAPRRDPRQKPGTRAYKPEYGRLSPPREENDGDAKSESESGGDEETLAEQGGEEGKEVTEALGKLVLGEKAGGEKKAAAEHEVDVKIAKVEEPKLELALKLDKDSSPKDIIVAANVSLSTNFRLSKDLWDGKGAEKDLKEMVRKKLQLHLKEIVENSKPESEGDVEHWEL
ncbi:hypothetical protein BU26DRAFT_112548 [Trematosphaeria pertusa]|uniref:Uncharacterized protein n=1 Tax=Trematosphaeria pertusa TaxID=390896 RepID=A0A6A6HZ51_9PLEO|nr:uncharacterized protein BU26DRAFT_112548 [Trematosphaeria pertusa]KAF2243179.1 hypothetical protein BU26DRAFT_112548 [Trematosphaeria pertusa]